MVPGHSSGTTLSCAHHVMIELFVSVVVVEF